MKALLEDEADEMDDRTDLVPLIDCVFLVLLFYVVAATFSEETVFPVQLPRVADAVTAPQVVSAEQAHTLFIAADGALVLDKTPIAPAELAAKLRARIAESGLKTLIIRGDKAAPYERIARIFELAQSLGITDLAMVVEAKETPPTPAK